MPEYRGESNNANGHNKGVECQIRGCKRRAIHIVVGHGAKALCGIHENVYQRQLMRDEMMRVSTRGYGHGLHVLGVLPTAARMRELPDDLFGDIFGR